MESISYKLDSFEGPLDLLLHLIAKNKLNILDIQLSILIEQYLSHIQKMQENQMDVASSFLEMASRLIYLKTISLLPQHEETEILKEELTGELIEYNTCRKVAAMLSERTDGFDSFVKPPENIDFDKTYELQHEKDKLLEYYISAVGRGQRKLPPKTTVFGKIVAKKVVAVSTKIVFVLRNLVKTRRKKMRELFTAAESRSELVATFLAVLELCKNNRVRVEGAGDALEVIMLDKSQEQEVDYE
ncbi:MAG: segregation/condensation protein A [Clostridia bacterium]|nr:segregation/condensation protein A [Clostridia bacterium]